MLLTFGEILTTSKGIVAIFYVNYFLFNITIETLSPQTVKGRFLFFLVWKRPEFLIEQ